MPTFVMFNDLFLIICEILLLNKPFGLFLETVWLLLQMHCKQIPAAILDIQTANSDLLHFITLYMMTAIQMTNPSFIRVILCLTDMINVSFELEYRQLLDGHYLNVKWALLHLLIVTSQTSGTIGGRGGEVWVTADLSGFFCRVPLQYLGTIRPLPVN